MIENHDVVTITQSRNGRSFYATRLTFDTVWHAKRVGGYRMTRIDAMSDATAYAAENGLQVEGVNVEQGAGA